jgi:F0F1-type ATP synthase delta subunit
MENYSDIIKVISASKLSEDLKTELSKKLQAKFGDFPVEYFVDESNTLVLGLVVSFRDYEYSYNLAAQTNYILSELLK